MARTAKPINSARRIFKKYKYKAKIRRRVWGISFRLFQHLTSQSCFYCDAPPANKERYFVYSGLDRVDSSKGYIPTNVLPCCWKCNGIKSNKISFEEMVVIGRAIREFREMGRGPKPPANDITRVKEASEPQLPGP